MSARADGGSQAFAAQCRRWAAATGAGPAAVEDAAALAVQLAQVLDDGHSCVLLDAERSAAARLTGIVGAAEAPGSFPLVLDSDGRLYLHRHFAQEGALAARLAALACAGRLQVIAGGPGTGKTSAVARLLGGLLQDTPTLRVLLAAPTGKAAARLQEALRERAADLPGPLRALLPASAATVHRVLQQDARGRVRHHAAQPLPADVLVIDEASMLDLALAARVCDALAADARLVLLGDPGQLAAVESGAVFAELAGLPAGHALGGCVNRLEQQYRFAPESAIARLAAAVRAGDASATQAILASSDAALVWRPPSGAGRAGPGEPDFAALEQGYGDYWQALAEGADIGTLFAAFGAFRVLCALRSGPWGSEALGARLDRSARGRLDAPPGAGPASAWYRGRPVMVTRNDPLLQLYNGDVGIALPDAGGELQVWFASAAGGFRAVAPVRLQAHETAFASSVHKSQGSEFGRVAVVLPPDPNPVLSRELLYTALTRARQSILLLAAPARIAEAVQSPTVRSGGLRARLDEALVAAAERRQRSAHGEPAPAPAVPPAGQ